MSCEEDPRHQGPKDWKEVKALQATLRPLFQRFSRVTGRSPPIISPWESYTTQNNALQQFTTLYWRMDHRGGDPPSLAELTEEKTEDLKHSTLFDPRFSEGTPAWLQQMHHEQNFTHTQSALQRISEEKVREQRVANMGHRPAKIWKPDLRVVRDSVVAQDHKSYNAWLTNVGYGCYTQHATSIPWEQWCDWFAPTIWEFHFRPRLSRNSFLRDFKPQHHRSGRTHAGVGQDVPVEQAIGGWRAWKASRRPKAQKGQPDQVSRYDLTHVSPAQICPILGPLNDEIWQKRHGAPPV